MNHEKMINRLLIIASIGLSIAGILFLCLSIFSEQKDNTELCIALGCVALASLFGILRNQNQKRRK